MAMEYRYVSKNGKYKTRWRPGPVDAIMIAHRAKPPTKATVRISLVSILAFLHYNFCAFPRYSDRRTFSALGVVQNHRVSRRFGMTG
jgi:hypothetical protein